VIACQSENNIPIVGKNKLRASREMHWIRVDAYFKGDEHKPEGPFFQPVPCMHCEKRTVRTRLSVQCDVHSSEGLNDMVYNRCVGTKYARTTARTRYVASTSFFIRIGKRRRIS